MKKIIFLLLSMTAIAASAQTIGTKKKATVKLLSYECGDFCYIDLKDEKNNISYTFENVDEKTKNNEIFQAIQNDYYAASDGVGKMIGQEFVISLEFRFTDELKYESTEEPPHKTGKKLKRWMINEIHYK
jgi:NADH:ubiquinone oxidoreductase subunit 3 (subunit A)